jgi:hypothetical protein
MMTEVDTQWKKSDSCATMTLVLRCPKCGDPITFSAVMGGIITQCPRCHHYVELPTVAEVQPKNRFSWLAIGATLFALTQVCLLVVWVHFRQHTASTAPVEEDKDLSAAPAVTEKQKQTGDPSGLKEEDIQKMLTNLDQLAGRATN